MRLPILVLASCIGALAHAGSVHDDVAAVLGTERFVLTEVGPTVAKTTDDSFDLVFPGPNGDVALALAPHSVRSPKFQVLTVGDGGIETVDAPPPATWRGLAYSEDVAAPSPVAASITDGGVTALIRLPDGTARVVQPAADLVADAPGGLHVVYDAADVAAPVLQCGRPELEAGDAPAPGPLHAALAAAELAIEADVAFYNSNGGSVPATVTNVESVVNAVTMIYESDVAISYLLTAIVVQTGPTDNYSSNKPNKLLDQFQDFWNDNLGGIDRDTAHLLHGKTLSDSVAGLAYVGVVCNKPFAYGWTHTTITGFFSFRVAITAHELGHNWSASHCNGKPGCEIMCSIIGSTNGCTGGTGTFSQNARNKITNYLDDDAKCVGELPDPLVPPVHDPFDKLTTSNWLIQLGAKATKKAIGETSGAKSVGLDLNDELRSNKIDLSALAQARVELFVAARGVEAGEELVIEGLDNGASWTELRRVAADGEVDDAFGFQGVDLPGNTLHADFQLRLRPDVDEKNDDFYVDDFRVFDPGPGQPPSLRADAVEPLEAVQGIGEPGSPANQTISIRNDGRSTANLPWTAAEVVDAAWLSLGPAAGSVLTSETEDIVTVSFDPTGLPTGRHLATIRLTNGADGSDTVDVPVALVVHVGTYLTPGDTLTGFVEISGETDLFSFTAAAGEKLKLTVQPATGDLKPRLTVYDPQGAVLDVLDYKGKKKEKTKLKLPEDGMYVVEIGAKNPAQSGDYEIGTARKAAKNGGLSVGTKKPSTSGGTLDLPVTLPAGASLSVTVVPVADGDGPFTLTVDDRDGQPVDVTAFTRSLPTGGVLLHRLPFVQPGTLMVHVSGFAAKEKVVVTIDPGAPPAGEATHVVP